MTLSREERRLIVLSAGVLERRRNTRELVASLLARTEWSRLTEALHVRRLLPTLGPRILDLAAGGAGEEFAAAVTQAIEAGRRQATLLQLVGQRATDMLADAGIRCASLKGPQLGEAIYGDVGRRLSSDIDLLVAPEELGRAVEVVRVLGYEVPTDYVEPSGLPQLHFGLRAARGELPSVEIHWRIHWYERRFARERLLPADVDRAGVWRPAPVDELAALLLYYARDGFVDLRLATDLGAWWDRYGAELPRGALDELLQAYPELVRVLPVALEVAGKVVGLPTAQILERDRAFDLRDRVAIRLANPNPHASPSQIYADIGLIDGLLMPPGGLRSFVRRQVFLPHEVLDEFDRYAPKRRARSSSLARGAGILGRYGLTMTRLLHLPETLY
jgi:hypothetical protein